MNIKRVVTQGRLLAVALVLFGVGVFLWLLTWDWRFAAVGAVAFFASGVLAGAVLDEESRAGRTDHD